jgi:hypothetical protein
MKHVTITLPDASYEPAAMAVLSGLYLLKPWPELLAELTPQQQVQAAVVADVWQLPTAIDAAVGVMKTATNSTESLSGVLEQLFYLDAVPDCLLQTFEHCWQALLSKYSSLSAVPKGMLPVLEQIMLSKYGDLEAVWAPSGASLQKALLELPLYAMELLLASDKLKVRGYPHRGGPHVTGSHRCDNLSATGPDYPYGFFQNCNAGNDAAMQKNANTAVTD